MFDENSLHRVILDHRYTGETAAVQYDILDARSLLNLIRTDLRYLGLSAARLAQILRQLDMRPMGLVSVKGNRYHLWTNLPPQHPAAIKSIFRDRIVKNLTELRMELVVPGDPLPYSLSPPAPRLSKFDLDVLQIRLEHQGLRYPRPHEIAMRLYCLSVQVNASLQKIRRVLRIKSMKDAPAFRRAAKMAGLVPITQDDF